jgi:hypothetical protein
MLTLFSIGDTPTSIDMPYGVTSEFILIFNIGGEENRTEHSDQSTSDEPTVLTTVSGAVYMYTPCLLSGEARSYTYGLTVLPD